MSGRGGSIKKSKKNPMARRGQHTNASSFAEESR